MKNFKFSEAKKIVVKIGSSIVTNKDGVDEQFLFNFVEQLALMNKKNIDVVVVSSGAVAAGLKKLKIKKRPHILSQLQAAAAVGQMDLVQIYQKIFLENNLISAQVLLTHDDFDNRKRYLNARSTLHNLLENKVIPIINENDTVATDEIKFGDNDKLAAMVSNLIEADCLVLLTDEEGLFSEDPKKNSKAKLIQNAFVDDDQLDLLASGTFSDLGTGGMVTKIDAARRAALSGAHTIIASGRTKGVLGLLLADKKIGTFLQSRELKIVARKKWLADNSTSTGKIFVDTGAANALIKDGKSLLSVGIVKIEGVFDRGAIVACIDSSGNIIAQGLVNYSSEEAKKIIGVSSDKIINKLGYVYELNFIHRNNLVITSNVRKIND